VRDGITDDERDARQDDDPRPDDEDLDEDAYPALARWRRELLLMAERLEIKPEEVPGGA
jgi:hypothetical protein